MRTVIDIPDDQVEALDQLAAETGKSRAALIREALQALISRREPECHLNACFGLWGPAEEDGLALQERMRAEWPAKAALTVLGVPDRPCVTVADHCRNGISSGHGVAGRVLG